MAQRFALALFVRIERDARVEVPADNEDTLLRRLHGSRDDAIIIARVDDNRRFFGTRNPPAIAALRYDRLKGRPCSFPIRHDKQKR